MTLLTLDSTDIFYSVMGKGQPAIVLVHGGMCDHRDWDRIVEPLSARHAVIRLDLSGHGRSTGDPASLSIPQWAKDVGDLLDRLEIAPAVLVGHSMSSRIVAHLAWQRPELASGLVLLDGSRSHGGFAASAPPAGAASPAPASLAGIIDLTIGPFADPAARQQIAATMSSARPETMAACVTAMREWDMELADAAFAGLRPGLPVLAIQSTYHDQFTPRRSLASRDESTPYLDFLRAALPHLQCRILPGTGHFSMMEQPETVARLILDFASGTEP